MIAIILVNWNGHKDTIECLESLLRLQDEDCLPIIVDNGSTDGSLEAFSRWAAAEEPATPVGPPWSRLPPRRLRQPKLHHIKPDEALLPWTPGSIVVVATGANLGFAGANNVGMRLAHTLPEISHFWLLNNDTVVESDSLSRLRQTAADKPWAAIIGTALAYYHNPDLLQGLGGFFSPHRATGGHVGFGLSRQAMPSIEEVEAKMTYVMGASMFLSRETYDEIGPMSEEYFLYFEEADWAQRLGAGRRQTVSLDAIVYHKEGSSIGTSSLSRPSDTSLYYINTNLIRYMWKWHRPWSPMAWARILRTALPFLKTGDWQALRVLWTAVSDRCRGISRQGKITL